MTKTGHEPAQGQSASDNTTGGAPAGAAAKKKAASAEKAPTIPEAVATDEKFFIVEFLEKSNPNDNDDVILCHNGDTLICKRMMPVALPERFIKLANDTRHPVYTHKPGEERKKVSEVQMYVPRILRECTRQEYLKMRAEGTETVRRMLDQQTSASQTEQKSPAIAT